MINSRYVVQNLKEYMYHVVRISNWYSKTIGNVLLTISGSKKSFFNYVFYNGSGKEYSFEDIMKTLEYLKKEHLSATWVIDSHMHQARFFADKIGLTHASTPKKAFLNLKHFSQQAAYTSGLHFARVRTQEELLTFDKIAAQIFCHEIHLFSDFVRGILSCNDSNIHLFSITLYEQLVGMCILYIENNIAGCYGDGVFREFRNRGIGTQMLLYRIELAKQLNCQYMIAHCMSPSVNLYQRLGFKILGNLYLYVSDAEKNYQYASPYLS